LTAACFCSPGFFPQRLWAAALSLARWAAENLLRLLGLTAGVEASAVEAVPAGVRAPVCPSSSVRFRSSSAIRASIPRRANAI